MPLTHAPVEYFQSISVIVHSFEELMVRQDTTPCDSLYIIMKEVQEEIIPYPHLSDDFRTDLHFLAVISTDHIKIPMIHHQHPSVEPHAA